MTATAIEKHENLPLEIVEIRPSVEPVGDLRTGLCLCTSESGRARPITNRRREAWLGDVQVDLPCGEAAEQRVGQLECAVTHAVRLHCDQPSSKLRAGDRSKLQKWDGIRPDLT